ncbi:tryptophan-rich protein [Plasmodium vivax]|nr:tryptophan-rich protein [Plasmodium vivax]
MEAARDVSGLVPSSNSLQEITLRYKDKLLNMDKEQMILTLGVTMIAITSAVAFGVLATHGDIEDFLGVESDEESEKKKELVEKSEEWKRKEWSNWLKKLEQDWKVFNEKLQNEKKTFLEEKEEDWNTWIKSVEKKWTHFNPNMDKEFHTNMMRRSINWTESQWREWIQTEGRLYLDIEWKKWFFENQSRLDELIVKKWIQWKKDKIINWLMSDWKRAEQEHWEEFEEKSWSSKFFQIFEKRNYEDFKDRVSDEWEDWFEWVKRKDNIFITNVLDQWIKWKEEKNLLYNNWADTFVTNWINKKQWVVWVNERRNLAAKAKAALNKKK